MAFVDYKQTEAQSKIFAVDSLIFRTMGMDPALVVAEFRLHLL